MLYNALRAWLCAMLLAITASSHAEDTQRIFGSWTLRCASASNTQSDCMMFQNLVLKTGGQPVLQFGIGIAPDDGRSTVLVSLPLGIALPPGITIRIDEGTAATFPVERCEPDGCRAGMKLRDSTVKQLSQGQKLHVTFHDGARKPINVSLSLDGFSVAYQALTTATP